MRRPVLVYAAVSAAIVLVMVGYVGVGLLGWGTAGSAKANATSRTPAGDRELASLLSRPHLVFLQPSGTDPAQNQVAVAPLEAPESQRVLTGMHCWRLHVTAGHGVCLGESASGTGHLLNAMLQPEHAFLQPGLPSRTRVSPDGRWASTTVFVAGHSYASANFSTQTLLYDTTTGKATNLESFAIILSGQRYQSPDINFWGVTFAAGGRFYATLGTKGHFYLIQGDLDRHTASVIRDGVECPALSPDGSRIVYKARGLETAPNAPSPIVQWRLHLLDLSTMTDTTLGETRSVDDQVEWLDDQSVLYALNHEGPPRTADMNLWRLPVEGGPPSLFLHHAASPAVSR